MVRTEEIEEHIGKTYCQFDNVFPLSTISFPQENEQEQDEEDNGRESAASNLKEYRSNLSYSVMAVEAVLNLNDRHGSSLVAIRKYIQSNFPLKDQQTASFNALTLKGVNKAVASGELEKVKHSFKVTWQEKDRRKNKERQLHKKEKKRDHKEVRVNV